MSDIVERLKRTVPMAEQLLALHEQTLQAAESSSERADEWVKLRGDLVSMSTLVAPQIAADLVRAAAEIERLRAAVVTAKREAREEAAKVADEAIAFADAHRGDALLKNRVHRQTAVDIALAIRALSPLPALQEPK